MPSSTNETLYNDHEIFFCGDREIVVIDVREIRDDINHRVWAWTAADSAEIAEEHRDWFRASDECKPVMGGRALLISSSAGGGIAVIRRCDKCCLFYAHGPNAHSIEWIAPGVIAGAFSISCDQLHLYAFDADSPALAPSSPSWSMPLSHGHGVVWDPSGNVLWALSDTELIALDVCQDGAPGAEVVRRVPLPGPGGHDLYPWDKQRLVVTNSDGVYLFDLGTYEIAPLAELAGKTDIKSVSRHPVTGQVIFTQGQDGHWWSHQIQIVGDVPIQILPMHMYKARWNVASPLGEGS